MRSQFRGEEFFERNGQWGKREKIRPGVAKGVTDHGLGRTAIEFDGSEVVVGTMPADAAQADGQVNHQSLGDKTQLPVALIGGEFAANPLAVAFGFAVQVLVAAATAEGGHGLHPKVIGIGAQRVNGLLETDLDFESPAVEADDVQRVHGQIGAEENEPPPAGMNHPNKADQPTQRAPQQVAAVIEQLLPPNPNAGDAPRNMAAKPTCATGSASRPALPRRPARSMARSGCNCSITAATCCGALWAGWSALFG